MFTLVLGTFTVGTSSVSLHDLVCAFSSGHGLVPLLFLFCLACFNGAYKCSRAFGVS